MPEPRDWHSRGYLPHYDDGRKIQSITYRLADALPIHVVEKLEEQALGDDKHRAGIEEYLDAGHGSCLLKQPHCAETVVENWRHFDGTRYRLHAWVVMPNHVHVLIEPLPGTEIGKIVQSWKSYTAKVIGGVRTETARRVWQADYWDRFIRNEAHYQATVAYIHNNPVKAGLVKRMEDWAWSSAASLNGASGSAGR